MLTSERTAESINTSPRSPRTFACTTGRARCLRLLGMFLVVALRYRLPALTVFAVLEQETVEVEVEQPAVRFAQARPRALRVVHQRVGDEGQRPVVGPADDSVRAGKRAVRGHVEGALIRADHVYLVGEDAARELVVEIERLDRATTLELVQPVADAVHRAAERVAQRPCVAIVVAVGEQEVLRPAVLLEPDEPLRRDHRVDQHPLGGEVARTDVTADARPERLPVPEAGSDLLHGRRVPRPSAQARAD